MGDIISVGYRVKSQRGVPFRQWASRALRENLTLGWHNTFQTDANKLSYGRSPGCTWPV